MNGNMDPSLHLLYFFLLQTFIIACSPHFFLLSFSTFSFFYSEWMCNDIAVLCIHFPYKLVAWPLANIFLSFLSLHTIFSLKYTTFSLTAGLCAINMFVFLSGLAALVAHITCNILLCHVSLSVSPVSKRRSRLLHGKTILLLQLSSFSLSIHHNNSNRKNQPFYRPSILQYQHW